MDKIILPSNLEFLYPAIAFVMERVPKEPGGSGRYMVEMVIEEVFVNICSYAYPDGAGEVEIVCEVKNDILTVVLTDTGVSFDPTKQREPDMQTPIKERALGGLGIHLVRQYVDDILYHREQGKNILTVKIKLRRNEDE